MVIKTQVVIFFFFKQKTAYELRISDWSSDVCSSDLMVQTLMVESFQNSQRIVSVGRESIGLRSDFILKTEIREFQSEAFSNQVRVGIDAKLVKMPERKIVAAKEFRKARPANVDDMSSVIESFDGALGSTLRRLVEWTLITGESVWKKAKATETVDNVTPARLL